MGNETSKPAVNIIMPAYNAHKTIRQAIGSVVMQDDLDNILLTIVDDCSDEPYDYLLDDFHYMNIEILHKPENTGCGQSRQYGIDHCRCKYFIFLDTDDCLYSPDTIKTMYTYMQTNGLDYLYTDFYEERNNNEYIQHQCDGNWMHGKMYSLRYIKKNNIRFFEQRIHEDHAFNSLVRATEGKNTYINLVTYIWRRNPTSLTRSCKHDFSYGTDNYLDVAITLVEELKTRNVKTIYIEENIKAYMLNMYKYYNLALQYNVTNIVLKHYELKIAEFFKHIPLSCSISGLYNDINKNVSNNDIIISMIEEDIPPIIGVKSFLEKFCDLI